MKMDLITSLYVFMLAALVGLEVIRRVSPLLHTPLMSLTNALDAIAVVGAILTCDIECSAMVNRGANDGDTKRDVHRPLKVDELHRDVALVVVHGDDEVELFADASNEDRVG